MVAGILGTIMRWILACFLALFAAPLCAQDDIEAQFARDASQHRRDLADLYAMRGLPEPPKMSDATIEDIVVYLNRSNQLRRDVNYPQGTAALFYAQHGGELAIYLVGQNGLIAHDRRKLGEFDLEDAIIDYRLSLQVDGIDRSRAPVWRGEQVTKQEIRKRVPAASEAEQTLAQLLLPASIRQGLGQVRHLVVIANGAIATNPFAALPLGNGERLIDRMSVSISPGIFDLDQMLQRNWSMRAATMQPLIVGDPLVPANPDWQVPRLPGAAQEARTLAENLSAEGRSPTLLLGDEALKANIAGSMERASMLYFAAHGTSNPREPLTGGFLMLSGPTPQEAFLTAKEVQTMHLRAELVVLSACQSGLGFNHDGGVVGLARSFQKAGVPRVIMSLWSVSDEATVLLMDRFRVHLADAAPAEALRLAMLEARDRYPEPALWAPFTLFGTPR
jgi:CHAT domain-containing protein